MANEIPSSAIKFYDAPSGGNQVTSGIAGSKTVYGRITEPFSEGLTGQSLYTGFPYYGRSALSGTKNFICGSDVETFTLTRVQKNFYRVIIECRSVSLSNGKNNFIRI